MNKGTHFLGQPLYSQVLSLLNKPAVLQYSRQHSGERYIKSFDGWTHLVVMLYAVIHRFDSLREITASLQADARKLSHPGICNISARSTLSDANKRRSQAVFAEIYRDLRQFDLSTSGQFRFSDDFNIQFRLFREEVVSNQPRDEIGKKIVDTTMSSMLYLTDIFEHVIDSLNESSFP